MMAYTYFSTPASGYFPPLMYFIASRLGCLLLRGDILTLLKYPSMPCITFIREFPALPTVIVLLLLIVMDMVTRHILSAQLLVTCSLLILDLYKVLSGVIWYDKMRN